MNTFDFPVTVCSLATEFAMKTSGEQLLPPRLAASQVWHPTAVAPAGAGAPCSVPFSYPQWTQTPAWSQRHTELTPADGRPETVNGWFHITANKKEVWEFWFHLYSV